MTSLKRLAIYVLIFVVILGAITTLTSFWQAVDYYAYRHLYLDRPDQIDFTKAIEIIDLPHKAENADHYDRENYRRRLSNLLDTLTGRKGRPKAVVLDIFFENEPQARNTLQKAIEKLSTKTKVYGVYDMREYQTISFEKNEENQAVEIYENVLDGHRLHTIFDEKMGVLSYESELKFPREHGGFELIQALAVKVAKDIIGEQELYNQPRAFILPLGSEESINGQTVKFVHTKDQTTGGTFSAPFNIDDTIIIVGSLEADRIAKLNKAGTYLLGWALQDQLKGNLTAKQPLTQPWVYIGLVIFFGIFTTLLFALFFKYLKRLRTSPVMIALLSFLAGSLLLLGVGAAVLSLGKVIPIALPLISMILASLLAWRFAYKFLVTGVVEGAQKYDVFISYSRGNGDWVIKNVYEPLLKFRKPNGEKLNIFFDRDSIGIGEAFTAKYMWAIVDSRYFIPIFSEEYYGKNHCRNEMDLAYKRSVEKLITILPIAFSYEAVPQIYTHVNFLDITVHRDFIEKLCNELVS
ncbi:toll/interleukin-1 receptor domain-containing protein [Pareuzebyella sediminis]|uniref:toll/interleukin-1 receptor domain-containing protein n=1 Tax=Pareuzebyella sediminis TaxID=2607998 RepID=UPI0011EC37B6|nr:toll/interleukin-1 receptor domain-containing protein [Pareuzebyella sediminis]